MNFFWRCMKLDGKLSFLLSNWSRLFPTMATLLGTNRILVQKVTQVLLCIVQVSAISVCGYEMCPTGCSVRASFRGKTRNCRTICGPALLDHYKTVFHVLRNGEQYTMYSVQCTVYSVQCTVHSAQCTVYSVQCTVYSVQCTMYSVQCTVYRVQCTVYSVQCTVYSVQCTVYSVQCTVYIIVQCTVYSVHHSTVGTGHCFVPPCILTPGWTLRNPGRTPTDQFVFLSATRTKLCQILVIYINTWLPL